MLTDTRIASMRTVLYQIWANLYVEYVVKNPISPVEHTGGVGVANELFEGALESFIVCFLSSLGICFFFLAYNDSPEHCLPSLLKGVWRTYANIGTSPD